MGLGIAYEGLAHTQLNQDKEASKPLFENAVNAYDNCIKEAGLEFYDTTAQDVKNKYCTPYRDDVQKVLADL